MKYLWSDPVFHAEMIESGLLPVVVIARLDGNGLEVEVDYVTDEPTPQNHGATYHGTGEVVRLERNPHARV